MTHSDKAALRGEPGYVWRSGQDRRLDMLKPWVNFHGRILDNGCGLGTYLKAFGTQGNRERYGLEIEHERAIQALPTATHIMEGVGETLPFASNQFDLIFSNEVIEHVQNDQSYMSEMIRVCKVGGRIAIFCPNRWYPVEQHGIYWKGEYQFGNKPLVNYLPNPIRNRLAPHVRVYTKRGLIGLTKNQPIRVVHHTCIFGGYDNIVQRKPLLGKTIRGLLYSAEKTPLNALGLSHLLILEKTN